MKQANPDRLPESQATSAALPLIAILAGYLLLAVALLAPLASNDILPAAPDHRNHAALIAQAGMAVREGQFPLRVAPWQYDGFRYPAFQFYASTPYWLAGIIHLSLTPSNPWIALKIVYSLGLVFAGFFCFRAGMLLRWSRAAAALAGVAYMTLPYLLVNLHARGAFTEAFAQFLLPVVFYLCLRLFERPSFAVTLALALVWLILATSHLITFAYTSVFAGLFCLVVAIQRRAWKGIVLFGVSYLAGLALSAYQLLPTLLDASHLIIRDSLPDPYTQNWLTPLSTLLSLTSVPPEPLGGLNTPFLHANLGLPLLLGVAGCVYFWLTNRDFRFQAMRPELVALMAVFALAFWCAWSPVDFWRYLPLPLRIAQFPYRFLASAGIAGVLLFGFFAEALLRRYNSAIGLVLLVTILLSTGPYLPAMQRGPRAADILPRPDIGYGGGDYLYRDSNDAAPTNPEALYESELPIVYGDGWLRMDKSFTVSREYLERSGLQLRFQGATAHLPDDRCNLLSLVANGMPVWTEQMPNGSRFEFSIPASSLTKNAATSSITFAFQSPCGVEPSELDPKSDDHRHLWIHVSVLRFVSPGRYFLSVQEIRPACHTVARQVVCTIQTDHPVLAQLPVLYYPDLLQVSVDGRTSVYIETAYQDRSHAAVELPPGTHRVVAQFTGSRLGNTISLVSVCLFLIASALARLGRRPRWRS